jgi:uncharacterized protein (TIGR03032 family)
VIVKKKKVSNQPADASIPAGEAAAPEVSQVEYSLSAGLFARLARLDIALAFTSYQSSLLYLLGRKPDGGLHLHQSAVPKPMGLGVASADRLVLASGAHTVRYENVLAPHERVNNAFDACYVPRTAHLTGDIDAHDVGIDREGRPIFVNTRYNCLATVSWRHSFEMVWKPPFISGLLDGDKCHLNGMAMDEGRPAYVTAVSRSNVIDGWRDRRSDGGVVIDVATGRIVCDGLSMPHSPRMHRGELWVLNSGTGELGVVKLSKGGKRSAKGGFEPRAFCPGFLRGLAFRDKFAFVGLSKPRYKRFEGLALDQRLKDADAEPWCGVQVIDLETGACVDWLRIDGAVAELYDVGVIPGFQCPMAVSPGTVDAATLITIASTEDGAKDVPAAPQKKPPMPRGRKRVAAQPGDSV